MEKQKYIDLGLPSGTLWATCNVGAKNPEDYGYYFSFNESKDLIQDIPTKEEWEELVNECTWELTTKNGVNGYKIISTNGNHIFLPAADFRGRPSLSSVGEYGAYWSSTPGESYRDCAYYFGFDNESHDMYWCDLYYGLSVRYVKKELGDSTPNSNEHDYVDLGLSSGTKWASCNVGAANPEEYGDYITWDAATAANWGEEWRMPTKEEFQELANECTWKWVTLNSVTGYKVTGPNGNYILLPAAGYRRHIFSGANECGFYWSRTPGDDHIVGDGVYCLYINSDYYSISYDDRCDKQSVRLVRI